MMHGLDSLRDSPDSTSVNLVADTAFIGSFPTNSHKYFSEASVEISDRVLNQVQEFLKQRMQFFLLYL